MRFTLTVLALLCACSSFGNDDAKPAPVVANDGGTSSSGEAGAMCDQGIIYVATSGNDSKPGCWTTASVRASIAMPV